ncbi:MAG: hypothetical protein AAFX50_16945, partial [Acidobacteriota bacterium]
MSRKAFIAVLTLVLVLSVGCQPPEPEAPAEAPKERVENVQLGVALADDNADYASIQATEDATKTNAIEVLFPGRRYEDLSRWERVRRTPPALAALGA